MIAVVRENFDLGQDSLLSLNLFSIEVQEDKGERDKERGRDRKKRIETDKERKGGVSNNAMTTFSHELEKTTIF